jgi:hypothetical protein
LGPRVTSGNRRGGMSGAPDGLSASQEAWISFSFNTRSWILISSISPSNDHHEGNFAHSRTRCAGTIFSWLRPMWRSTSWAGLNRFSMGKAPAGRPSRKRRTPKAGSQTAARWYQVPSLRTSGARQLVQRKSVASCSPKWPVLSMPNENPRTSPSRWARTGVQFHG